jgi:hypothetical protein
MSQTKRRVKKKKRERRSGLKKEAVEAPPGDGPVAGPLPSLTTEGPPPGNGPVVGPLRSPVTDTYFLRLREDCRVGVLATNHPPRNGGLAPDSALTIGLSPRMEHLVVNGEGSYAFESKEYNS